MTLPPPPEDVLDIWRLAEVVFALLAGGIAALTALVFVRRRLGVAMLALAWLVETMVISILIHDQSSSVPITIGLSLFLSAAIIHLRAVLRPQGRKIVDVALALPGTWIGFVIGVLTIKY